MEKEKNNTSSKQETGALYALGMLSEEETKKFEEEIASGFIDASEVRDHVETVTALTELAAANAPMPRRALKDRIMAEVLASSAPKQVIVKSDEGEWEDFAPGIKAKLLFQDVASRLNTILVRLQPGAQYPHHRHVGDEQCLVLEGDLVTDTIALKAGDYIMTPHGTEHTDTHTDGGCLLLLTTLLQDEILTA
ncbi:MAG TPA: cupin domain-containing protein [Candidatus Kapabacteria bacterium]|nr:cupin domain-containing protein [Candidatus Kapabacteria bacterium]